MSALSPSEDIRSVTDLKRHTREILDHIHTTGRPVFLPSMAVQILYCLM